MISEQDILDALAVRPMRFRELMNTVYPGADGRSVAQRREISEKVRDNIDTLIAKGLVRAHPLTERKCARNEYSLIKAESGVV